MVCEPLSDTPTKLASVVVEDPFGISVSARAGLETRTADKANSNSLFNEAPPGTSRDSRVLLLRKKFSARKIL
jgi:hypothetical protein